jgi:hypothetical protein
MYSLRNRSLIINISFSISQYRTLGETYMAQFKLIVVERLTETLVSAEAAKEAATIVGNLRAILLVTSLTIGSQFSKLSGGSRDVTLILGE